MPLSPPSSPDPWARTPELWTIRVTCAPAQVETLEAWLAEEETLAVSSFARPREATATLEALVDGKPDEAELALRLALLTAVDVQEKDESKETRHSRVSGSPVSSTAETRKRDARLPPSPKGYGATSRGHDEKGEILPRLEILPVGNLDWVKKVAQDFPPLSLARWTVFGATYKDQLGLPRVLSCGEGRNPSPRMPNAECRMPLGINPRLALQIDATSAFGTGEHPTTRGCLILLDEILKAHPEAASWRLLDMGCGSGILAMAFLKAARGAALGIDSDAPSVRIASANARINGVADGARFVCSLGYRHPLVKASGPYDLIMANIFARPLCVMAKDLKRHLKPKGFAILSGILNSQVNAVLAAHKAQGISLVKRLTLGEWSALALRA